jgi:predicted RecB family endonuclease
MAQIKGLVVETLGQKDPAQIDALVTELAAQVERALRRCPMLTRTRPAAARMRASARLHVVPG